MEFLFALLVFFFVIGVMILIHEWGHFITAKKIGIHVEAFSIGFGPKLYSWKKNGTEYKISVFPLGGYVKMLAENPDEEPTGDPREFQSRNRWERFLVMFMGPFVNILFAYLIWVGIIMIGEQKEEWLLQPPVVEYVTPGGPASQAGIEVGDLVLAVNSQPMTNWEELVYAVATSPREEIIVSVRKGGEEINYAMKPFEDPVNGIGSIGVSPGYPPVISRVTAGMPAEKAGLEEGDVVLEINSVKVTNYYDIRDAVTRQTTSTFVLKVVSQVNPWVAAWDGLLDITHSVDMKIQRGDQQLMVSLVPEFDAELGIKRIGIGPPPMTKVTVHSGVLEAFIGAGTRCVDMTVRLYDILAKMITGRLSSKAISGPVEIAAISSQTAGQGLLPLLNLMAFISLNLGIVNLLPLPVLDGGQITILAIEGIVRRDLSLKVKEWIMRFGVILLFLLMALVISQDIGKLITRMG